MKLRKDLTPDSSIVRETPLFYVDVDNNLVYEFETFGEQELFIDFED